jgi:hypothetical protein
VFCARESSLLQKAVSFVNMLVLVQPNVDVSLLLALRPFYEKAIEAPISNILKGNLIQLLLIQVQARFNLPVSCSFG